MCHNPTSARDTGRSPRGEHRRGGEPVRADEAVLRVVVEGAAEGERREEHAPHCEEEGIVAALDKQESIRGNFPGKSENTHVMPHSLPGGKTGIQQSIHVNILANKISNRLVHLNWGLVNLCSTSGHASNNLYALAHRIFLGALIIVDHVFNNLISAFSTCVSCNCRPAKTNCFISHPPCPFLFERRSQFACNSGNP